MESQIILSRSSIIVRYQHKQTRGGQPLTLQTSRSTTSFTTWSATFWWFSQPTSRIIQAYRELLRVPAVRERRRWRQGDHPSQTSATWMEIQAAEAIAAGRAPATQAEGDGPSMRSSVRVDDNSHDISWVQGITPATLPPPMPLHPRTILSMRGSATGSWRGSTWSPPSNSLVRHPARLNLEPTVVVYKTLAGEPERGMLPETMQFSIYPAGSWIATTRLELGFARTPRYWLVEVDYAPPSAPDRMQLRTGDSFWLEWRGVEGRWQRRPRFPDDINALGGFPTIPQAEAPRPPTPPQRRDPTTVQRSSQPKYGGFNPQNFVDNRPLRGRLIPPSTPATSSSTPTSTSPTAESSPAGNREPEQRRPPPTSKAKSKAKPPMPPPVNPGSESETSWPSEDPLQEEQDHSGHLQTTTGRRLRQALLDEETDSLNLVQTRRTSGVSDTPADRGDGTPSTRPPEVHVRATDEQPYTEDSAWFSVAANFEGEFTVQGLLRLLQKILHEMLQQSFTLPNDYLTSLAYHACYYVSRLQSTNDKNQPQPTTTGGNPGPSATAGPTAMVFCITNSFVEAEAALESLAHHHDELPRRHIDKELRRADALLHDGRAIFKSWAKDPQAPGALAGTAASQNAIDGIGWACLALEEGGVATLEEALQQAWQAAQRCKKYMDELLDWIEKQFQAGQGEGGQSLSKKTQNRDGHGQRCPTAVYRGGGRNDGPRLPPATTTGTCTSSSPSTTRPSTTPTGIQQARTRTWPVQYSTSAANLGGTLPVH